MSSDKHRSIGERLSRAKNPASRLEICKEWAQQWFNEQECLLRKLNAELISGNKTEQQFIMRQLFAVNEKRHGALPRVFDKLAETSQEPLMLPEIEQAEESTENQNPDKQKKDMPVTTENVVQLYARYENLREVADYLGISANKVRKMLITAGKYSNPFCDRVQTLRNEGLTVDEIAVKLKVSANTVNNYLPYEKSPLTHWDKDIERSENAIKIHNSRAKQKEQE